MGRRNTQEELTPQNSSLNNILSLAHFNQAAMRDGEEADMHMWLLWN